MIAATKPQEPDLFTPKQVAAQAKPGEASAKDVAWFERLLQGAGCWMSASDILLSVSMPCNDDTKRWIKSLRAATTWIISGQKGYKHIEHATAEEIDHAANRLESMAKTLGEQAGALRSNAHRIFAKRAGRI